MDEKVEEATQLLALVIHTLDNILGLLESDENPEIRMQSTVVEDCEHLLSHVRSAIYAMHPDVAPRLWQEDSKSAEDARQYGRLILKTGDFFSGRKFDEAEQLWRDYLATEPFYYFEMMAKRYLRHLEKHRKEIREAYDET